MVAIENKGPKDFENVRRSHLSKSPLCLKKILKILTLTEKMDDPFLDDFCTGIRKEMLGIDQN